MIRNTEIRKRIITFLVVLMLTVSPSGYLSLVTVFGAAPDSGKTETVSVLAFTGDVHNNKKKISARRLGTWIDKTKRKYGKIDAMCICGDIASAVAKKKYWTYTGTVMKTAEKKVNTVLYTTGNHEYSHEDNASMYRYNLNKYTKKFIEDSEGMEGDNFRIYCMGSSSYTDEKKINRYSEEQINKLSDYLAEIGNEKPIIIMTHYPLHFYETRTVKNASLLIDTLNSAAVGNPDDTADDKKIVFIWGHNHSKFDVHYDQIFEPGDTITYTEYDSKPIMFFYGAAGCMSDVEYSDGSASVRGKGLVITINGSDQLTFTYYDENGFDVTEDGTLTEPNPNTYNGNTIRNPRPGVLLPCINAAGSNKLNISWTKVRGADGYDIYFSECNNQMELVQSLNGFQWTTDVLKEHTPYQAIVRAYYMQDGVKTYIRTSPVMQAYTSGGAGKYTNPRCVRILKAKKSKVSLKPGKTYKIKAKVLKLKKNKNRISKGRAAKLRFISSDKSIASVNKSGRITAKARGRCTIYIYAVNGIHEAITVNVK